MQFQSPLRNLCDVLSQIKDSAKQYQATLTKNEAATRAVLIDPVLSALGWDTANTNMVEVEKTLGQAIRADYALYDNNANPRIIVEAKSLGTNLNQSALIMSLVSYAFNFKLNDVFLTDGLIWQHFKNFQPGNVAPTKTLDVEKDDPVECASYFVQHLDAAKFWPVDTIDAMSQRIEQLESAVATLQKSIANLNPVLLSQQMPTTSPVVPNATPVASTSNSLLIDLTTLSDITGKKPSQLRLPDGIIISVKSWKDVLRECCKFALASNPSIPIPTPDRAGRKISLLGLIKPPTGVSYVTELYNGQTIFIYVNYDANNCIGNAIHILGQVPASSNKFSVAVTIN